MNQEEIGKARELLSLASNIMKNETVVDYALFKTAVNQWNDKYSEFIFKFDKS